MLDYMENLDGFLYRPVLWLLRYDQIDVHVGMDKIPVGGSSNGSFDSHQAVFFSPLEYGFAIQILAMPRIVDVGANPANVLAASEAPFAKAESPHVQTVAAAAPEKHEASIRRYFADIQFHYLRTGRCTMGSNRIGPTGVPLLLT